MIFYETNLMRLLNWSTGNKRLNCEANNLLCGISWNSYRKFR